jgi:tRNA pseudouridine55 synthase
MDGVVLLDKPAGISSRKLLDRVMDELNVKKAGYLGTLDPFATGVLPIVIGRATKLGPYFDLEPKGYQATLKLGEETDTLDRTGRLISQSPVNGIDEAGLRDVFSRFQGAINQLAPSFSALKHKGVALYRLARKGQPVPRKERQVQIHRLQLDKIDIPLVSFSVECAGGTYIRALARDIGQALGCGAHLVHLRRVQSGSFLIGDCFSLEELKEVLKNDGPDKVLIPLPQALAHLKSVSVAEPAMARLGQGQGIPADQPPQPATTAISPGEKVVIHGPRGEMVAVAEARVTDGQKMFCPLRVLV